MCRQRSRRRAGLQGRRWSTAHHLAGRAVAPGYAVDVSAAPGAPRATTAVATTRTVTVATAATVAATAAVATTTAAATVAAEKTAAAAATKTTVAVELLSGAVRVRHRFHRRCHRRCRTRGYGQRATTMMMMTRATTERCRRWKRSRIAGADASLGGAARGAGVGGRGCRDPWFPKPGAVLVRAPAIFPATTSIFRDPAPLFLSFGWPSLSQGPFFSYPDVARDSLFFLS